MAPLSLNKKAYLVCAPCYAAGTVSWMWNFNIVKDTWVRCELCDKPFIAPEGHPQPARVEEREGPEGGDDGGPEATSPFSPQRPGVQLVCGAQAEVAATIGRLAKESECETLGEQAMQLIKAGNSEQGTALLKKADLDKDGFKNDIDPADMQPARLTPWELKELMGEVAWEANVHRIVKYEKLVDTMKNEFQAVKLAVAMVQGRIDDDHALKVRADKQERD